MILEIISRVASGLILLTWVISLIFIKKYEVCQVLFIILSISIFAIGFIDGLCTVLGL